ncbi:MAG: transporter [Pseudomonadota bacterium]
MKISIIGFVLTTISTGTAAMAGGFDRGGVNIDLLFDGSQFAGEATGTYVFPQRTLDNVIRDVNVAGGAPLSSVTVGVGGDFFVPRVGFKVRLGQHADCLATYSQPFGADADYGLNNAHSASSVAFEVESDDIGLTCSANFNIGTFNFEGFPETRGRLRLIGGVSYLDLRGTQGRQTFADFAGIPAAFLPAGLAGLNTDGVGDFSLSDDAFGFRVGFAYEIPVPDAARGFRISAIYSSRYKLNLDGTVDTSAFNTPAALAFPVSPVSAETEIPQSVEVKMQAPIASLGILADASFKWQDWSQLGSIPIAGVISPVTGTPSTNIAFEPLYEDGITIEVGVATQLAEGLSGRIAGRFDKGTSTTFGFQTDTWSASIGLRYKRENIQASLGASAGILTSGSSSGVDTLDPANDLSYSFGDDFVGAISGSLRISF